MSHFLLSEPFSSVSAASGIDTAKIGAPFRVSIYNPDAEAVTVETAPDTAPIAAAWQVLGTVNTVVGSVVVTAPVPRLRFKSDGAGANVFIQILGPDAAPV